MAIAEQHAVTFAAGLAIGGYKPVVAIYSTFLQRAYDQLIHDVAIQNLPVLFAIDRAGIVGADGQTHQGAFGGMPGTLDGSTYQIEAYLSDGTFLWSKEMCIRERFTAALSVAMTASFSSCSDSFLDEKNKSSYTTDYFKTSQDVYKRQDLCERY